MNYRQVRVMLMFFLFMNHIEESIILMELKRANISVE